MKKIYTLLSVLLFAGSLGLKAQDTLLYEGFQADSLNYILLTQDPPPANMVDSLWYDYDLDQLPDGSTGNRSDYWYLSMAFADADSTDQATMDTNLVIISNSWFTSPGQADNWLITRNILLGDHDTLFWKSAPFQTPRYLDGYEVKISTTTNEDVAFNTILFTAAEMDSINGTNDSVFSGYDFSSGFVHGLDSTYIEFNDDSARWRGVLRPFFVPLDTYANQNVFIAFHHNSFDDNLISIDDILIRGTINPSAGIKEREKSDLGLNVFPNPANDYAQINFQLAAETEVAITVSDITGKLVYSENKGSMTTGRHFAMINTAALEKGFYTIAVQTNNSRNTAKLIVK